MSEERVRLAASELEKSTAEFNEAVDLLEQKFAAGAKEVGRIVDTVKQTKQSAEKIYEDTFRIVEDSGKIASDLLAEAGRQSSRLIREGGDKLGVVLSDRRVQLGLAALAGGAIGYYLSWQMREH